MYFLNHLYLLFWFTYILQTFLLFIQVMVQRHNRHMSISVYISVLAVTDSITLLFGEFLIIA